MSEETNNAPAVAPTPSPEAPSIWEVKDNRPVYPYEADAKRSRDRVWGMPGWRRARTGGSARPSDLRAYSRVFLARLRVPDHLVYPEGHEEAGLPIDGGVARMVRRYTSDVHGRIVWYECALKSRNLHFQWMRVATIGAVVCAVAWAMFGSSLLLDADGLGEQIVPLVAAGGWLLQFIVASRNDQGVVEGYITALQAMKKELHGFEEQWDDRVARATIWPDGFRAALQEGVDAADAIEDAERMATLTASMAGTREATSLAQSIEAPFARLNAARAARVSPTPVELAENELSLAIDALKRGERAEWGELREAKLGEFRQAVFDAETKLARARRGM